MSDNNNNDNNNDSNDSNEDKNEDNNEDKNEEIECTSSPEIDECVFTDSSAQQTDKPIEKFLYEILSIEQIVKLMQQCIEEVKSVVNFSSAVIRQLLKHFKWDQQKLFESLCDENQQNLFKEIGILPNSESNQLSERKRPRIDEKPFIECAICFQVVSKNNLFGLDCSHFYCKQCWEGYLTTKIMDYGDINVITCAETNCKMIIDDDMVLQLLSRDTVKSKYYRLTTNSFVENNRVLRWCPKADCMHAFKVKYCDSQPVKCVCGTVICFKCGESNHEPIECDLLKQWNKKSSGNNPENIDGQTANWIVSNTKECPKCQTSIEKNGGCNHMTCKSVKCKYEFCWVCLGSWSSHGTSYYSCNRYNNERAKTVKESQSDQRKALEKYMFYWTRFMNHKQSLKFENELYSTITTKMTEMQDKYKLTWIEVQFMEQAVDILCNCRKTLMYTYVFAYYTESTPQLMIFEENQGDLQVAVEKLSEYFEKELRKEQETNIKAKVLDLSTYCENRRKVLIQHIHEGYEKEWWTFNILADIQ